jgi:hypothetical protein
MSRVGSKVTAENKAIAEANGIPTATVYARLKLGWDVERAVSEKPVPAYIPSRGKDGENVGGVLGKIRSIRFPKEYDEAIDQAIVDSGINQSAWLSERLLKILKKELKLK